MNTWSEGTGPPGVFVPETVAVAQVLECLAHDAADGPDINVLLVPHAEDDFGRTVVTGHDVGGHHEGGSG